MSDWEKGHGRVERRHLARVDRDWHISPFPRAQQLIRSTREWFEGKRDELKCETRYFIISLESEERSAARLAQAIRGHWWVENKNHGKRDASLRKEDASRPRKKASGFDRNRHAPEFMTVKKEISRLGIHFKADKYLCVRRLWKC